MQDMGLSFSEGDGPLVPNWIDKEQLMRSLGVNRDQYAAQISSPRFKPWFRTLLPKLHQLDIMNFPSDYHQESKPSFADTLKLIEEGSSDGSDRWGYLADVEIFSPHEALAYFVFVVAKTMSHSRDGLFWRSKKSYDERYGLIWALFRRCWNQIHHTVLYRCSHESLLLDYRTANAAEQRMQHIQLQINESMNTLRDIQTARSGSITALMHQLEDYEMTNRAMEAAQEKLHGRLLRAQSQNEAQDLDASHRNSHTSMHSKPAMVDGFRTDNDASETTARDGSTTEGSKLSSPCLSDTHQIPQLQGTLLKNIEGVNQCWNEMRFSDLEKDRLQQGSLLELIKDQDSVKRTVLLEQDRYYDRLYSISQR